MNILKLIKERKTIRKYTNKPIPKRLIDKIIEAGIWGPSLLAPGFQPWCFVVITNKKTINTITEIMSKKSKESGVGINGLLSLAAKVTDEAMAIVLIYNSGPLRKFMEKYKEMYSKFKEIIPKAELSAISAAIQNMILAAEVLGIGSCWLDIPLFCEEEINRLVSINDQLVAVLTLGYPREKGKRSPRKSISETVKYII